MPRLPAPRSTQRPNGWNYYTCCDCTHFCFSPAMWHAHLYSLQQQLVDAPGIKSWKRPDPGLFASGWALG